MLKTKTLILQKHDNDNGALILMFNFSMAAGQSHVKSFELLSIHVIYSITLHTIN